MWNWGELERASLGAESYGSKTLAGLFLLSFAFGQRLLLVNFVSSHYTAPFMLLLLLLLLFNL